MGGRQIDNLRRERVVFDEIQQKLARELQEKKKQMAQVLVGWAGLGLLVFVGPHDSAWHAVPTVSLIAVLDRCADRRVYMAGRDTAVYGLVGPECIYGLVGVILCTWPGRFTRVHGSGMAGSLEYMALAGRQHIWPGGSRVCMAWRVASTSDLEGRECIWPWGRSSRFQMLPMRPVTKHRTRSTSSRRSPIASRCRICPGASLAYTCPGGSLAYICPGRSLVYIHVLARPEHRTQNRSPQGVARSRTGAVLMYA